MTEINGTVATDLAAVRAALAVPKRLLHVGTRMGVLITASGGSNFQTNSRIKIRVPVACRNPRLVYVDWSVRSNAVGEMDNAVPITMEKAGFEPTFGATPLPVMVAGKASGSVDPGGTIVTDALGIAIPAATDVGIRTHQEIASGVYYAGRPCVSTLGEGGESGVTVSDKSLTGTITANTSSSPVPVLMVATPDDSRSRSVAIFGDSIATSSGDVADPTTGWLAMSSAG